MEIINLETGDENDFLRLYDSSFPVNERRIYKDTDHFRKFVAEKRGKFNVLVAKEDDLFLGFISYWDFGKFVYIEHFAVEENLRGRNIGGRILDYIIKEVSENLVLEVELPTTHLAMRRINFYKRMGFILHEDLEYYQPPYSCEKEWVRLLIMTHGSVDLKAEKVVEILQREVYDLKS